MPLLPTRYFVGDGLVPSRNVGDARMDAIKLAPGRYLQGQTIALFNAGAAQSEIQTATITGAPTGGSIVLAVDGRITTPLAYNANAAAWQAALAALPNVGAGNVTVSLAGAVYTITYGGQLANQMIPLLTLYSNALTGGTAPSVTMAETQVGRAAGAYGGPYTSGATNGLQTPKGFLKYPVEVANNGTHAVQSSMFGECVQDGKQSAPVYVAGTFLASSLVTLDAATATAIGRLIDGTAITDPGVELAMY